MDAESRHLPPGPLRSAFWALACGVVTSGVLLTLHGLEVRDRPDLPPILPEHSTRVDAYGDPLPLGAVARLGSKRFRVGAGGVGLEILPDGKRFVAGLPDQRIGVFDVETGVRLRVFDGARSWVRNPARFPPRIPWPTGELGYPSSWSRRALLALGLGPRPSEIAWVEGDDSVDGFAFERFCTVDLDSGRTATRTAGEFPLRWGSNRPASWLYGPRRWRRELPHFADRFADPVEFAWSHAPRSPFAVVGIRTHGDPLFEHDPERSPCPCGHRHVTGVVDDRTGVLRAIRDASDPLLQVAWDDRGRLWSLHADRAEVRDPDTLDVVEVSDDVIASTVLPQLLFVPGLESVVVGDRVLPLPAALARRWREPGVFERDADVPPDWAEREIRDVAAHVDAHRLLVALASVDGNVRTFAFDDEGRVDRAAPGHRTAISDLVWDPAGRRIASLDRTGRIGLGDVDARAFRMLGAAWRSLPRPGNPFDFDPTDQRGEEFGFVDAGRAVAIRRDRRIDEDRTDDQSDPENFVTEAWSIVTGEPVDVAAQESITSNRPDGSAGGRGDMIGLDRNVGVQPVPSPGNTGVTWVRSPGPAIVRSFAPQSPGLFRNQVAWRTPIVLERIVGSPLDEFHVVSWGMNVSRRPGTELAVVYTTFVRARLVHLTTGTVLFTFPPDEGVLTMARWSPSGDALATGANDGSILIWDVDEMIAAGSRYR